MNFLDKIEKCVPNPALLLELSRPICLPLSTLLNGVREKSFLHLVSAVCSSFSSLVDGHLRTSGYASCPSQQALLVAVYQAPEAPDQSFHAHSYTTTALAVAVSTAVLDANFVFGHSNHILLLRDSALF